MLYRLSLVSCVVLYSCQVRQDYNDLAIQSADQEGLLTQKDMEPFSFREKPCTLGAASDYPNNIQYTCKFDDRICSAILAPYTSKQMALSRVELDYEGSPNDIHIVVNGPMWEKGSKADAMEKAKQHLETYCVDKNAALLMANNKSKYPEMSISYRKNMERSISSYRCSIENFYLDPSPVSPQWVKYGCSRGDDYVCSLTWLLHGDSNYKGGFYNFSITYYNRKTETAEFEDYESNVSLNGLEKKVEGILKNGCK